MAEIKEEVLVKIELEQDDGQFKKLASLKNVLLDNKAAQKQLNEDLKKGAITQKEYAEEVVRLEANHKKLNAEYSNTQKQITGLKSPFDKLNEGLAKQTDTLSALSPALGASTNGFISMGKAIYTALIANPVTAIVIGLVAAITGLVKIFTSTEEGGDMLAKTMAQLGAIFNVLFDRAALLGGALVKLFTGDFTGAIEDATAATTGLADEMAREAKEAGELADILDKLEDRERSYKVAASATTLEIKRLIAESKNRSISEKEKIALLEQARDLEIDSNKKLKQIRADELNAAIRKIQLTTEGAKLQREADESELEFAQRLVDQDTIQGEARDELAEHIIAYNEVQGESLVIQEKINNQIDANIEKQEAKRLKTIELMVKEDEKNKKDADEITKRITREDALELKLEENRIKADKSKEEKRTKEIMGDMLVGNNKLIVAAQVEETNARIAKQDEEDLKKKLEGWAKFADTVGGFLDGIFNAIQGHYDLQENELAVTLANQKTANQEAYNEELKGLQDKFDKGEISKEEYDAAILGANQRFQAAQKQAEIDQAKALNEIKKKEFEANKKQSIIDAGIAAGKAILQSFVQLGWPLGLIPAAAMAALAAIQINQIKETEFVPTAFAGGGKVLSGKRIGPNDGRSIRRSNGDNLLATVKTGEVILNEQQQARLGGAETFRRIGVPGFALGGLATDSPSVSGSSNVGIEAAINRMVGQINQIQTVLVLEDFETVSDRKVQVAEKADL